VTVKKVASLSLKLNILPVQTYSPASSGLVAGKCNVEFKCPVNILAVGGSSFLSRLVHSVITPIHATLVSTQRDEQVNEAVSVTDTVTFELSKIFTSRTV